MGKQLVLISHGKFCEALKESTEMIMGPQENIHTVPLLSEEGQEQFKEKFEKEIESLDDFVVLCDLMGGTPCTVVSKMIMRGADIKLYAGMNMPMVLEFINSEMVDKELDLINAAVNNTAYVNDIIAMDDADDEE
ncbi:PTS sugar transporter subunit IIA [Tetragenococcus halophilus]|uniref:PTS sugar transporter subunit IIA n=1 Tax=Tetragenococcus halophilus TaxID=51669 RepID=UPI001F427F9F|nr:PTS fructose transporter subunit IIA [Tetragenococcus halophilus]MDN5810573.1 PTS fructose transporter subunit IIA [Tetragenococcus koreensis]MDN6195308.1 PTS fructose transporter subunit IIA [Atopostipes suicloacalis]MDN6391667.1 PTS fructose transporter subunit IIA [Lactococcus lactis]MCF1600763.1 PTS fructose transporter subunit IIA [Tetragenococcus halophilus]MCF1676333.1 PTS fructose transporter subunit IIA [Tetragenococcus halophilus]